MDRVECVVIGAGVIGLAVARAIAMSGREVLIVEAENRFGMGTSSRNSEVIHAGIYYPQGSLKAQFCVRGREMLYAHCASHDVQHRRCGKLIVAANEGQIGELETIKRAAEANGVFDMQWLDRNQALALEPNLHCAAALLSPSTGIIDSHGYMLSLLGDAEAAGAMIAYSSAVADIVLNEDGGGELTFAGQDEPAIAARLIVNAAGLSAPRVAAAMDGLPAAHVPKAYYAKGNYFTLPGRAPFSRLVYPVPEPGGLGVHLTLDLGGQARFGPDVEWIDRPGDYNVDPARADKFYAAIRAYWPALEDGLLQPAYSGIRPKLSGKGEANADFRIDGPAQHGAPGVINLFGIESPGLTSSLAIAEQVSRIAETCFDA